MADSYTELAREFDRLAEAAAGRDLAPVSEVALRDSGIALAALSIWAAADAWHAATGLAAAQLLSVLNGLAAGWVLARLAHEWGHFAGARWAGGIAPTTPITKLFPIYVFDLRNSSVFAFRAMGIAGNVAHWCLAVAFLLWIPLDAPGRVALACSVFGFALGSSLTELPIVRRSFAGVSSEECFVGLVGAKLRRNQWIGFAAGALLFALLV